MQDTEPEGQTGAGMPRTRRMKLLAWYYVQLLDLQGRGLTLLVSLLLLTWIASGFYKVQPDEQGVILQFGRHAETTGPGLHFHWPFPVETVWLPKVTEVKQLQLGNLRLSGSDSQEDFHEGQMLTGDENIVEAECTVLWRIKDASQFLFNIQDAPQAVKVTAESALREIIGRTPIQSAMSDKRQQIADETRDLLQRLLDKEKSGILIVQVQLQRVDPPKAVIDAFNDVQRARADQERARNDADSYANDILPRARGEANRIIQEAQAYQSQIVNLAEGDAKGFLSVYASYGQAKEVTAWRLYLESVDDVLRHATKVIIDSSGKGVSGIVPYLPMTDRDKVSSREPAK
ncbi:FtsH protease activity modulator HflK [Sphaerotilus sp.]|uniref:FtsH protease activity modulator HflK n=1 Tax=Sphaerotilus sp. TaxID=2093942 RepID=UPI0034E1E44B